MCLMSREVMLKSLHISTEAFKSCSRKLIITDNGTVQCERTYTLGKPPYVQHWPSCVGVQRTGCDMIMWPGDVRWCLSHSQSSCWHEFTRSVLHQILLSVRLDPSSVRLVRSDLSPAGLFSIQSHVQQVCPLWNLFSIRSLLLEIRPCQILHPSDPSSIRFLLHVSVLRQMILCPSDQIPPPFEHMFVGSILHKILPPSDGSLLHWIVLHQIPLPALSILPPSVLLQSSLPWDLSSIRSLKFVLL